MNKGRPASLGLSVKINPEDIDKRPQKVEEVKDDRSPKEVVLAHTEEELEKGVVDERYQLFKWFYFLFAMLSGIIGMTIVFYAIGYTVLFSENPFNSGILAVGCIFFIPTLIWIYKIFFPSEAEKIHRALIHERRRVYKEIQGIQQRWEYGINEEEYQRRKRLEAEEEAEYQRTRGGRVSTRQSMEDDEGRKRTSQVDDIVKRKSMAEDMRRQSSGNFDDFGRKSSAKL